MTDALPDEAAGGLDEPEELQPEQGSLTLTDAADDWTRADWEKAAAAVLRKARRLSDDDPDDAVWQALTRTTLDGVAVSPLGTPDLLDALATSGRPTRAGAWDVRAWSAAGDAKARNAELLADLEGGATSVWVDVPDPAELPTLLEGVLLDAAAVVLDGGEEAARALLAQAGTLHPHTNLGLDASRATAETARLAQDAGVLGFVVDATAVHTRGASDVQELGWAIATGADYLRTLEAAGVPVDDAARLVEFRLAATDEQFPTIAKLRAVRRLWARVLELCGSAGVPMRLHVVTSKPMMTVRDPWVNLLRTTVAAFAAGVGGADAVTVLPFDSALGRPDAFGRRLARNTSALLVEESHVAAVTDPAGGAYAVEKLTDDLAAAAWAELGRIETDGREAFEGRVADLAARRRDEIAHRRLPLTGLSEFPNLEEKLPSRAPYDGFDWSETVASWGADFEAMRAAPVGTHVFLATMGSIAAHTARAGFASNLLAAGGIAVDVAGATEGVDDVLAAYDGQPVVCLAGTDPTYAEWAGALVTALRDAGARHVILAGRPVEGVEVDDTCAVGVDAVAFLTRTREALA